nr:hypothetical protein [uncultured Allomuricauda sp.]
MDSMFKYRISVLMDSGLSSAKALQNAAKLAKVLNGRVEVVCIKSPLSVVKQANQFSAKRDIYEDSRTVKTEIQGLISKIGEQEGLNISFQINYGNIKNKLKDYLITAEPDILVLTKRRYKSLGGIEGKTNLLIMGDDDDFHSFKDISLGVFGETLQNTEVDIIKDLKRETSKPVRLFSIRKGKKRSEENEHQTNEAVTYVFSEGANALDGLTSYVKRTKTELFCISKQKDGKSTFQNDQTDQILRKVSVPVLLIP